MQFLRVGTGLDIVAKDFCWGFEELVLQKKIINTNLNAVQYNASSI